ncbi:hypothetical protein PhaeoP23_01745 [Phaeobacter piscinae]|uniref:GmrSD restriction endonucleases N-terminal domain-containing protein n=1 Tax=Phaeobacter piscinae TaxID=1580596 RepID=A0ABM6PDS2_9RHOB|nr:DUF262 domain-containing protein [Phaeobacter piscinae]ATG35887.1 hypothetical protein PhaeoP36_01745 [Phaeobacter piscinae]AUQ86408.1 hypothetical protein PhaeoP42_01746 [Phaeobacter piscinae]AUR24291.1 hypothetical protein PhaeoP23_01745 [Phaeobacter piscinae]
MEARTKTVEDWFAMIREGHLTLPRFQRFEAWRPSQIEGVLENILRVPSLPIGALLLLEVGDKELFHSRPLSGAPSPKGMPQMNLLDGQQRMTALWRSLIDNYDEFTIFVSLENEERPEVEIVKRYVSKSGKRMPLWADNPVECLERRYFPVSILCPGSKGEHKMDEWTETAETDKATDKTIMRLRQRLASYPIPFLSLPVTTEQETALDVFIKMNTSASPLKDFDIVVAQLEGAVGDSLHDMIADLNEKVPAAADYGKVEDVALAIGALLNGKPPLKRTYLDPAFGSELANVWDQIVVGLKRGVSFLRDEAIFNERLLPTEVIVYLTGALWAHVPIDGADQEGRARTLIRKAIWRASFTDRYLKTATTRAFADYKAIQQMIVNPDSGVAPDLFDEAQNPLPAAVELIRGGWPSRKDRLGRAIVAVSLYDGGYDFADGAKATADNVRFREYHHVYPRSLLQDQSPDHEVNSALNCALISWKTNRKIAAKNPKQYLEERGQDANATEGQVRQRLESHRVPYDDLVNGDFQKFIETRANLIHSAMQKLCEGSVP